MGTESWQGAAVTQEGLWELAGDTATCRVPSARGDVPAG